MLISAELISMSDVFDARIHGTEQEWSLMPQHALFSCVFPLRDRTLHKRLDFPSYLGQNSKQAKNSRLLSEICHRLNPNMTRKSLRLFVGELIFKKFIDKLAAGDINESVKILCEVDLEKDDMTGLGELLGSDLFKGISAKNKAALTRGIQQNS